MKEEKLPPLRETLDDFYSAREFILDRYNDKSILEGEYNEAIKQQCIQLVYSFYDLMKLKDAKELANSEAKPIKTWVRDNANIMMAACKYINGKLPISVDQVDQNNDS